MDNKERSEELKFIITRFDHYYDSVNNKGNFYLAVNTFTLGGMIAGSTFLLDKCGDNYCLIFLLISIFIAGLVSLIFTLMSIKPYLNSKNDNSIGSLLYFGDVADYHENQLYQLWDGLTSEKYYTDLRKQSSLLAKGLATKFQRLNVATWALIAQFLLITIFSVLITIK